MIVNHKINFVYQNTGVNTNGIEGSWSLCKRKFKYMFGTKKLLFLLIWMSLCGEEDFVQKIIFLMLFVTI
jgi:hypothetical protein